MAIKTEIEILLPEVFQRLYNTERLSVALYVVKLTSFN